MKRSTILLIVGFVLLWNSGFIGAEYGLPYTGPFTLIFLRYLAVTVLLVLYLAIRKRLNWVGFRAASLNMLIGFLAHGVWLTCVLLALAEDVPAGIVALIVALQPLATGALSGYVTNEKTNTYQWWGLILGFIGVVLTVAFRIDFSNSSSIFGYLIPLGSVIGITIATLIQRRMEINDKNEKLPLDQTLFYQSFATALALAFPAIFIENVAAEWVPEFTFSMIWLILAVSLGAYILMWRLIERLDATRVASLFYLGPPITMLMAWLAFGDTIKIMDIVGLSVVFLGVILTSRGNSK
ncbi:DMT family transporter [Salegentibacter salegens]|uniref:Permease of the drug/metabolite transporter (DMT) superfamily n=1 Tax=Salegentibacter salegens TaxID=143223 RepID=A0A1M7MFH0_9FLAO|nr:DMT family transporter [Salegentibacter salegens]PRX48099.1 drug/metabolite transporter (DMT)-like permease [Salegentibacter salegens]SHM89579.1 Permease of the drug/metabolite transporter (DMT) superfamily [Salegentibacter salegens]